MVPVVVINQKRSLLSRIGRWTAELVLVFIGVYAAFWLNNYQQHRQDAERRDRILASLQQELRRGIESGKTVTAQEEQRAAEFRRAVLSTPGFVRLVGDTVASGSGSAGRPDARYQRGDAAVLHPALLRPSKRVQ